MKQHHFLVFSIWMTLFSLDGLPKRGWEKKRLKYHSNLFFTHSNDFLPVWMTLLVFTQNIYDLAFTWSTFTHALPSPSRPQSMSSNEPINPKNTNRSRRVPHPIIWSPWSEAPFIFWSRRDHHRWAMMWSFGKPQSNWSKKPRLAQYHLKEGLLIGHNMIGTAHQKYTNPFVVQPKSIGVLKAPGSVI